MAEEFNLRGVVKIDIDESGIDQKARQAGRQGGGGGSAGSGSSRGVNGSQIDQAALSESIGRAIAQNSAADRAREAITQAAPASAGRGGSLAGDAAQGAIGVAVFSRVIGGVRRSADRLRATIERATIRARGGSVSALVPQGQAGAGAGRFVPGAAGGVRLGVGAAAGLAGGAGLAISLAAITAAVAGIKAINAGINFADRRVGSTIGVAGSEFSAEFGRISLQRTIGDRQRAFVAGRIRGEAASELSEVTELLKDARNVIGANVGATTDELLKAVLEKLVPPLQTIAAISTIVRAVIDKQGLLKGGSSAPGASALPLIIRGLTPGIMPVI